MLPMLSGMVPVSWLRERSLQQWVGGDASEGWNGDVRELERDDREGEYDGIEKKRNEREKGGEPSKPILNTYSRLRLVMLPMLSGIVPVSWLPLRFLQQWVGGGNLLVSGDGAAPGDCFGRQCEELTAPLPGSTGRSCRTG